jgi:GH15 family glucan-1,4-alpha-glucosidase
VGEYHEAEDVLQQVMLQLSLSLNASKLIRRRTHVDEWRATRDTIYKEIMENGWSEEQQSFVQSYGSDAIDASALLISLTGFTAEADPRIVRTIERIQRELMLTYANHLGLYSEEVGPVGEALGNFPQAFTHLALISACHALDKALGRASLDRP